MAAMTEAVPGTLQRIAEWPLRAVYFVLAPLFRRTSHLLANYWFAWGSARAVAGERMDVCIAHDSYALNAAARIAARGGRLVYDAVEVPLIAHRSGRYLADNLSRGVMRLINEVIEPGLIRRCDLVISNSPGHARWHREHYALPREPVLAVNARPFRTFARSARIRTDAGLGAGDRLVLYIGNASAGYGLEELLRALARLPAHVHLGFLGWLHPTYAPRIAQLVDELGVATRFHRLPTVNWDEVPEYASGADVGVVTLQREVLNMALSLPNRFFDCVAARLPIAASALPAVTEQLDRYGIGMSFDERNPDDIARVLGLMLDDAAQARFRAAAERAAAELCWERVVPGFIAAIEGLAPGRKPLRICFLARKNIWHTRRVVNLAEALREAGHEITVICPFAAEPDAAPSGIRWLVADDGRAIARRFPQVAQRLRAGDRFGGARRAS